MSGDTPDRGGNPSARTLGRHRASERPTGGGAPEIRKRRAPKPSELALLRWLLAKPRPVTIGPIGNCVKRGWCEPVRSVVEDHDGRRMAFVYVVTEAGSLLLRQHEPKGGAAVRGDPIPTGAPPATTGARLGEAASESGT